MSFILFPKLSSLRAENCGIAILNPGWSHPSRNLHTSVLILGKKSTVEITEEDDVLTVTPEKFVILSAERNHWGSKTITESASYYWMHFATETAPTVIGDDEATSILRDQTSLQSTLADALLLPQEIPLEDPKRYLDLFHDLLFEQEQPSFTREKFLSLFKLLLINANESVLSRYVGDKYDATRFSLIYAVIQTILENYTDGNFSVKTLSDIMNYHPDYLSRMFKLRTGKSIGDYIIEQRIKYAICLLIETNNTVESIAYDSGFNSTRNFVRQFKARKGETPTEHRFRHRAMHVTSR